MKKTRVIILFGGRSAEHEISLLSARNVLSALDRARFEPVLVGIDKAGRWHRESERTLEAAAGDPRGVMLDAGAPAVGMEEALVPQAAGAITAGAVGSDDVVFPVLHGTFGEDGTVQGALELAGIAYVGAGVLGSAIGMDKDVAKRLLRDAGIPVVDFAVVTAGAFRARSSRRAAIAARFRLSPLREAGQRGFVGRRVTRRAVPAISNARCATRWPSIRKVLVERGVDAREIECAVLGNDDPQASIPGEIVVHHKDGFYSYDAKYVDPDGASWKIPAELPPSVTARVRSQAVATFRALELAGHGARRLLRHARLPRDLRQRGEHHPRVHGGVDVPEDVGGVGSSPERAHHAADRARDRAPRRAPRAEDDAVARSLRTCRLEKRSVRYARPAQKFPCIQIASRSYIRRGQRTAAKRGVGRPSKAQPFRAFVVDLLLKEPNLRSLEIVARARAAGYDGGKSALYSLIASVRPRRTRPLSDHDRVPGEIARHGFGQVDVRFREGGERTLTFFVSRLEYSRFVVGVAGPRPERRDVRAHAGGAPRGHGRRAAAGGVRSAAPDRRARRRRRPGDRVGSGVRLRRARAGRRRRGARAARRRARSRHEPRQLAEARVLQDRELRRRGRRAPRSSASGCATTTRARRTRSPARRPRSCSRRNGSACGRSSCSRASWRCAFPVLVGPRASVVYEGQSYAMPPEAVGSDRRAAPLSRSRRDRGRPLRDDPPARRPSPRTCRPRSTPTSLRRHAVRQRRAAASAGSARSHRAVGHRRHAYRRLALTVARRAGRESPSLSRLRERPRTASRPAALARERAGRGSRSRRRCA